MQKAHINQLDMYARVLGLFERDASVVERIPGLSMLSAEFKSKTEALDALVSGMDRVTDKMTENKNKLKLQAAEKALSLGKSLEFSATRTDNELMINGVATNISNLVFGPERVILSKMNINLEMAKQHQEALKAFGVTNETLREAELAITAFKGAYGKPKRKLNEIKADRLKLKARMSETAEYFKKQVRTLVESNKSIDIDFFSDFDNAAKLPIRTVKLDTSTAKPATTAKTNVKTVPPVAETPAATADKPASTPEKVSWKNAEPSASV